jgi:hypothetical protein
MTLILTVANASGVYQSSDYQLTTAGAGAFVSDRAGLKQLQASYKQFELRLAFTGIAIAGSDFSQQRTIDGLSEELKALQFDSQLQDICEALARRSTAIANARALPALLEIILTVAAIGEPFRVAVISNFDLHKGSTKAKPQFSIRIHTITKPFHLISGYRPSVPSLQRHRLRSLARDIDKSPEQILNSLSEINAIAAKHGRGYVSEACWVTSQIADDSVSRSASLNIGQHPGSIPLLTESFDMSEWVTRNLRAVPGKEIRLVQSAGLRIGPGGGTPLPPMGEPRRFTLSGSSVVTLLRSPAGDPCISIDISELEGVFEMRCNEEVILPVATVRLSAVSSLGHDFPRPLIPWPELRIDLKIDDVTVPRGCQFPVGYWIEDESHHVVIPHSSRSIRNVAFLGAEDEMVIVAPSTTLAFAWGKDKQAPQATIQVRVSWRSRLDGTRG